MSKFDLVEAWLDNVAYSHSKSEATEESYRLGLKSFCDFIRCTPQRILDEYEGSNDRQFRRKYARCLRAYISHLSKKDYTASTIQVKVTPVKSFFKYNDLPLGYVPIAQKKVTYHNRDITKAEIVAIVKVSNVRNRAFYTVMAQSGLGPIVLCGIRVKHIEPDFSKGIIPCCMKVPEEIAKGKFGAYFSFMGQDAVDKLRAYFRTRELVGPEDYVFANRGSDKPLSRKSISNLFSLALDKLKDKGIVKFEQYLGKPRELRLYCLRKWFRNQAAKMGAEYVNFMMGHRADYKAPHIPASDDHYFSREDVEALRAIYREKAMPYLRLETETPGEVERTIVELRERIKDLEKEIQRRDVEAKELEPKLRLAFRALEVLDNPKVWKFLEEKAKE